MINENSIMSNGIHPADIQASLKKRGLSQKIMAERLKVSQTSIYKVIKGQEKSQRIASAIAEAIEQPVEMIWPGHY